MDRKIVATKQDIDSKHETGNYYLPSVPGFHVHITSTGSKIFRVKGKLRGSRRNVVYIIGRYGSPWTIKSAAEEALQIYFKLRKGIDPNQEHQEREAIRKDAEQQNRQQKAKDNLTLSRAMAEYFAAKTLSHKTLTTYKSAVAANASDWLDLPLSQITPLMIQERYIEIASIKPGSALMLQRFLVALYKFMMGRYTTEEGASVIRINPALSIGQASMTVKLQPRESAIASRDLYTWHGALNDCPSDVRDLFLLLLFTGARLNAVATLRWVDIDFESGTITLKDNKQKNPSRKRYKLPITKQISEILNRRRQQGSGLNFVFDGLVKRDLVDPVIYKHVENVVSSSGVEWHPHALRKTFATEAAQILTQYQTKALLNHSGSGDVTATHYIRVGVDALREPLQQLNDALLTACTNKTKIAVSA